MTLSKGTIRGSIILVWIVSMLWLARFEAMPEAFSVTSGGYKALFSRDVLIMDSWRYYSGLINLFNLFRPICNYWMIFDNSVSPSELIAEGYSGGEIEIINHSKFETLKNQKYDKER